MNTKNGSMNLRDQPAVHAMQRVSLGAPGKLRWVKKVFERLDEIETADGVVVYNFGTLRGEWPDGEPFEGVRYIDRFLVRDGKIADQKVWNDLCLAVSARPPSSPLRVD